MTVDDFDPSLEDAIAHERICKYLGSNGDAVQGRVDRLMEEARSLAGGGYFGPALTVSVTATELFLRFFVLRPMFEAGFHSDEWAGIIAKEVFTKCTARDRSLAKPLGGLWQLDVDELRTASGRRIWKTYVEKILPRRNEYVHLGALIKQGDALLALECAEGLQRSYAEQICSITALRYTTTGSWNLRARRGKFNGNLYETKDPLSRS